MHEGHRIGWQGQGCQQMALIHCWIVRIGAPHCVMAAIYYSNRSDWGNTRRGADRFPLRSISLSHGVNCNVPPNECNDLNNLRPFLVWLSVYNPLTMYHRLWKRTTVQFTQKWIAQKWKWPVGLRWKEEGTAQGSVHSTPCDWFNDEISDNPHTSRTHLMAHSDSWSVSVILHAKSITLIYWLLPPFKIQKIHVILITYLYRALSKGLLCPK